MRTRNPCINVIKYPSGRYGYAGYVPDALAYRITGGSAEDRQAVREAIRHTGPGIARRMAERVGVTMEDKAFDSAAEAYDVASAYVEAHNLPVTVNPAVGE